MHLKLKSLKTKYKVFKLVVGLNRYTILEMLHKTSDYVPRIPRTRKTAPGR